jgi:hypothetical protein
VNQKDLGVKQYITHASVTSCKQSQRMQRHLVAHPTTFHIWNAVLAVLLLLRLPGGWSRNFVFIIVRIDNNGNLCLLSYRATCARFHTGQPVPVPATSFPFAPLLAGLPMRPSSPLLPALGPLQSLLLPPPSWPLPAPFWQLWSPSAPFLLIPPPSTPSPWPPLLSGPFPLPPLPPALWPRPLPSPFMLPSKPRDAQVRAHPQPPAWPALKLRQHPPALGPCRVHGV